MRRIRRLLPFALLCACATPVANTEDSAAPGASAAAAAATASPSTAAATSPLDVQLLKTAQSAERVFQIKLRFDAQGNVVKQSVYHVDADAIPEPVRARAKERFPHATVTHYESEYYADIGRVYEVEVDDGGRLCELAASADGVELYTECHVDAKALSDAIKATVDELAPGGEIVEAESKQGPESEEEIWIEVRQGDRELYLRLRADGSLIQAMRRVPAIVEIPL